MSLNLECRSRFGIAVMQIVQYASFYSSWAFSAKFDFIFIALSIFTFFMAPFLNSHISRTKIVNGEKLNIQTIKK